MLDVLGEPSVFSRIGSLIDAEAGSAAAGRRLAEVLHRSIGGLDDRTARRALLQLRRDAYQNRHPKHPPREELLDRLPKSVAEAASQWIEDRARLMRSVAESERWVEEELRRQQHRLQALVQSEDCMRALLLASPQLASELDSAKEQGLELSIQAAISTMAYAIRMATKTSPYSTFASTVPVVWADGGRWLRWTAAGDLRTRAEIVVQVFGDIQNDLLRQPAPREHLLVRQNPSCHVVDGDLWYVAALRPGLETVRRLRLTPAIGCVLSALGRGSPELSVLVRSITELDGTADAEQVFTLVQGLRDAGVLAIDSGVPDQSPDHLGELIERLEHDPAMHTAVQALAELRRLVCEYPLTRSHPARSRSMRGIQRIAAEVIGVSGGSDSRDESERQIIVEDAYRAGTRVVLSTDSWKTSMADLTLLGRLLELQDPALAGSLLAARAFTERYGVNGCRPLLGLYDDARREAAAGDGAWGPVLRSLLGADILGQTPEGRELAWRRSAVCRWLQTRPREGVEEIELDRDMLQDAAGSRPAYLPPCSSLAAFCLPMSGGGDLHLVLDAVQACHGRLASRLARMTGESGKLPDVFGSDGPLLVELAGTFSWNLNLRGLRAPVEISYPGSVSSRPPSERLSLDDLWVRVAATSGRLILWSDRLSRQLLPVHLGMGTFRWLPPLARFILGIFSDGPIDAIKPWQALWQVDGRPPPYGRFTPRLRLGSVVFDRRKMLLRATELPRREKAEGLAAYLIRVERWRRATGLDVRCFIRFVDLGAPVQMSEQGWPWPRKERKPMLLDFANPLSVLQLGRLSRRADTDVIIEEVLPRCEELPPGPDGRRQVVELVLELRDR